MDKSSLIEELQAQKEQLDQSAALLEESLRDCQNRRDAVAETLSLYEKDILKIHAGQEPKTVRNRSYDLLEGVGHPLHPSNILKILTAMGIVVGGQDPQKNLIAHMSQDTRFKSFGEGNWGLVEWKSESPLPEAPSDKTPTLAASNGSAHVHGLLADLKQRGVTLNIAADGKLAAIGPYGNLPPELQQMVKTSYNDILASLKAEREETKTGQASLPA